MLALITWVTILLLMHTASWKTCSQSLNSTIFPDSLKIAKVTPMFKSGDKGTASNYRPKSTLPVFPKHLERIMSLQSSRFQRLFIWKTVWFQRNKLTEHVIIQLTRDRDTTSIFEKGKHMLGVFINFSIFHRFWHWRSPDFK